MTNEVYIGRPRDLAITDFRCEMRIGGLLTARSGRTYLLYERVQPVPKRRVTVDGEFVPAPARRVVEMVLCVLCGGGALTALWFTFFVFVP